ncbi:methylated-DNA/protein-cysteine methyltransferase [Catenovulum agarivorans DS-2]|uniref:methylated-DNA--[protein]-cysteine S-methyltransferase n=1 Tax=Catenovulum agarivorans DS-2 TaxID=1328313 RepID=W7R3Q5_9ALTE|nr:methylated-DNA--[protein]-cysteine S-methyltransferase [Catenovulum agarivorans]EWH12260.1 methylated-DNA/protein-cysteine methyltransferase [Catenovulum agarivorans DS-2]
MRPIAQAIIMTPIGKIAVMNTEQALTQIDLQAQSVPYQLAAANSLTSIIVEQINAYFAKEIETFELPIDVKGTQFQEKVWRALGDIPFGKCLTYGELATHIETSARAIGGACRNNPIPIVIPCHRIVAANGIGGYSGQWRLGRKVDIKRWLLKHEQSEERQSR